MDFLGVFQEILGQKIGSLSQHTFTETCYRKYAQNVSKTSPCLHTYVHIFHNLSIIKDNRCLVLHSVCLYVHGPCMNVQLRPNFGG